MTFVFFMTEVEFIATKYVPASVRRRRAGQASVRVKITKSFVHRELPQGYLSDPV